mmetsp:Transcript_21181/g.38898  ORF Transcript_21181/g.38898 Transcript_21181/m.38898 type:complete len:177 (-) Transcript_21181:78-608(-)
MCPMWTHEPEVSQVLHFRSTHPCSLRDSGKEWRSGEVMRGPTLGDAPPLEISSHWIFLLAGTGLIMEVAFEALRGKRLRMPWMYPGLEIIKVLVGHGLVSVMMAVEESYIVAATVAGFGAGCGADGTIGTCKGMEEMEMGHFIVATVDAGFVGWRKTMRPVGCCVVAATDADLVGQ